LIPEKRVCDIIDEIRRNGVKLSAEISRIIEQAHGIEVPPHIIAEYKYRKLHNQEIQEDFFGFEKGKQKGTKTAP
jgi:hypothetical protein